MEKEAIKEKLTLLRLLLTTFSAFFAGCFAWFINNLATAPKALVYFDMFAIMALILVIIVTYYAILINIKRLGG